MVSYEEIFSHINEKEVVECLQDLVRAPSENPPGDYSEIKRVLIEKMESIGFEVELIGHKPGRENIIGILKGTVGKPVLMFETHVDTVPVGDKRSWTVDPFGGNLADGKVWGRGADDQKNCTAAVLMAVKAIRDAGMKLKGDLMLVCTIDEETGYIDDEGNPSGEKYLSEINFFDRADLIIYCVLFNWNIPIISRGTFWVEISTKGRSGHPCDFSSSGKPIINAISKMMDVLFAVQDIDRWMTYTPNKMLGPPGMISDKPIVSPDVIQAGFKTNIVPDFCRVEVDMRILPGQTGEGVSKELNDLFDRLKKKDPDLDVEFKILKSGDPIVIDMKEESHLLKAARKAVKTVLNYEPVYCGIPSSAGFSPDYHRKIMFGPKFAGSGHAANEFFPIDELINATKIYAVIASELAGIK